jgi:hypothetical protein
MKRTSLHGVPCGQRHQIETVGMQGKSLTTTPEKQGMKSLTLLVAAESVIAAWLPGNGASITHLEQF